MNDQSTNQIAEILTPALQEKLAPFIESKVIEILRAVGIRGVPTAMPTPTLNDEPLLTAIEAARLLGYDVSTKEAAGKAKHRMAYLARMKYIPCVRESERIIKFTPQAIREFRERGGHQKAA